MKIENSKETYDFSQNKNGIFLSSSEISCLSELWKKSYPFLMKKKYKFRLLFKVGISINTEEKEAFEFMEQYFKMPLDNSKFLCFETKFVYVEENGNCVLTLLKVTDERELFLEVSDTITPDEDMQNKYENLISAAHKVIKY